MDYYRILGVDRNADQSEIKKAFKKRSMKHHPDKGGDEEEFKRINEAYQTLSNPQKRAEYDNPQPRGFDTGGFAPHGFEDVFSHMFGQGFAPQRQMRNENIMLRAGIELEDVLYGKTVMSAYTLRSGKQETVEIKIPTGIEHGQKIRYPGLGDDAIRHLPRGDLFVEIKVRNHPIFRRDGIDLHMHSDINVLHLITGTTLEINTLGNRRLSITVPPGAQPNTTFSVPDYGLPHRKTGQHGKLFVSLKPFTPTDIDATLLEQIKKYKDG